MKGTNKVTLNQETMCEAVQHYFERVYKEVPAVKSVKAIAAGYGSATTDFEVEVEPQSPGAAAVPPRLEL